MSELPFSLLQNENEWSNITFDGNMEKSLRLHNLKRKRRLFVTGRKKIVLLTIKNVHSAFGRFS